MVVYLRVDVYYKIYVIIKYFKILFETQSNYKIVHF